MAGVGDGRDSESEGSDAYGDQDLDDTGRKVLRSGAHIPANPSPRPVRTSTPGITPQQMRFRSPTMDQFVRFTTPPGDPHHRFGMARGLTSFDLTSMQPGAMGRGNLGAAKVQTEDRPSHEMGLRPNLWAKYQQIGTSMGMSGQGLAMFVGEQVRREEEKDQLLMQLRAQEAQREREASLQRDQLLMQLQAQETLRREEIQAQETLRREEIQAQEYARKEEAELRRRELQAQESMRREEAQLRREEINAIHETSRREREPVQKDDYKLVMVKWDESQDLDFFLLNFERVAKSHRWEKDRWGIRLADQLTGRAQTAYLRLTPEEPGNYDLIKKTLLEEYKKTPDHYRRQFREIRKTGEESFKQFVKRQRLMFERWIDTTETAKSYEGLKEFCLLEQLLTTLTGELATYVRERKPETAAKAAEIAFEHLEARRETRLDAGQGGHGGQSSGSSQGKPGDNRGRFSGNNVKGANPNKGKEGDTKPAVGAMASRPRNKGDFDSTKITCYKCHKKGHFKRECKENATNAIHTKKKVSDPLWGELKPLCGDCEEIPFQRNFQMRVNGTTCRAMRDTGADDICVKPKFVRSEDYLGTTETVYLAVLKVSGKYPKAIIDVDSPFVKGRVQCIVIDDMGPDIFIGEYATREDGSVEKLSVYPRRSLLMVTRSQAKKEASTLVTHVEQVEGLDVTPETLKRMQREDDTLRRARESAEKRTLVGRGGNVSYKHSRGILKRTFKDHKGTHTQVCVPQQLRRAVLKYAHDTAMSGHLGEKKTRERVWSTFYWPGMCAEIQRYCRSCDRCQKVTPRGKVAKVPLGKMPLPCIPFETVAVDIVGPVKPASDSGHRYILVMVDYATRYPEAVALKGISVEQVAEALWTMWSRLGIPKKVLTDRGTQFTSDCMAEVYRLLAVKGQFTTPYHAQCNGLVERFNGTLKSMLRKVAGEQPKTWDKYIPALLFAYREVPQESTGFSPFELLYGRTVRGPMAILRDLWTQEENTEKDRDASMYVLQLRNRIESTCKIAKENLEKEGARYKKHFDRRTKNRSFKAGDRVLLLLPHKQNKLEMTWKGPFPVEERVGEVDYKILIRGKSKLYHANMLKYYIERPTGVSAVAVIDQVGDEENWEEVKTTREEIPLIQLEAEESVKDVHLDPDTPELHEGLLKIVNKHARILTDLPKRTTLATCEMGTEHERPIRTKQYPLPFLKRDAIGKEVDAMLRLGVISPSISAYSSPIVLVVKPDGKYRFCVDYRAVNKVLSFDAEPMPDADFLFSKVAQAKYFTKIDLCKGYWQIPMAEKDKHKTAFTTPQGCYQWNVMPFGLKTAGAVFTRMMRSLIRPLNMPEIENFIDDVLVSTDTVERHLECVEALMARLDEANLAARPSKVYLGYQTLEYLGHQIGFGKIHPMQDKLDKIKDTLPPTTKKQVRSFLGLAGYYRKFVQGFATIARPLTDATKKYQPNKVVWNKEMGEAFKKLKEALTSEPVCVLPNFNKPFILRTDASDYGLGALLMQDQGEGLRIVACASKKLKGAELNYSTVEKECYALVWGVKRFSPYLHGAAFVVQSDHQPLEFLQGMKATNRRLMRWALQLQPYSISIQAIPGTENVGADYLSRAMTD